MWYALFILFGIFLLIYATTVLRTWTWNDNPNYSSLRGLALPNGSIRGLIAFLVIGGFLIFIFVGANIFPTEISITDEQGVTTVTKAYDEHLFTTILSAFSTLTGAIAGFYFGGRESQPTPEATPAPPVNGQPEEQVPEVSTAPSEKEDSTQTQLPPQADTQRDG